MTGIATLLTAFLGATIPSLTVGIILQRMSKKSDERYRSDQEAAEERAQASQIQMQMIMASAALSYSCAVALKRGETNGEVEEAVAEYALAKKRYLDHINSEYFKQREAERDRDYVRRL